MPGAIKPKKGDLRVWWIPQVPMNPFYVEVTDVKQALFLHKVLADYDIFQFENKVKPDYSNVGGLEIYYDDGENGGWCEWEDDEGRDINDLRRALGPVR